VAYRRQRRCAPGEYMLIGILQSVTLKTKIFLALAVVAAIVLLGWRGAACISEKTGRADGEKTTDTRTDSRSDYRALCVSIFGESRCPEKK
jgi:hypothetical protein